MFTSCTENSNSKRSQTLMIGDSWDADIVGAHNSRIHQIWYNPKGKEPIGFQPTYMVAHLAEIKNIL